jgi:REP element-mobilizing transposase RayT
MARKRRLEVEGGLYHVITRGNDRQDIFHCDEDFQKFLSLVVTQKEKAPFYLYAWCLMTNHIHLLIERQAHTVGRIMQRVLTGYSQWYNRRYRHIGHVFQGRHKAILCDSDTYLAELVRYIHLNPVRAKMVSRPEDCPYSSHREYLGLTPAAITDVDPLLRRFGNRREVAVERFREYVAAGVGIMYPKGCDSPAEACATGSEDFVDKAIHRMGELTAAAVSGRKRRQNFDAGRLTAAVESVLGLPRERFLGIDKNARSVMAKEVLIVTALELGATVTELAQIMTIDSSNVGRRADAAHANLASDSKLRYAKELVEKCYAETSEKSHV